MARKVRGFERVLDAPALFTVAYDEIGSSIYFALGIVAAQALGLTPVVLLATGLLFLVVSLSYAEGTAAIPETGGAATFTRRAYNDLVGFATGWVLLLDYLIVISLSTLFLPHYLAAALSAPSLADSPWDVLIAIAAITAIIGVRLVRHTRIHRAALGFALLDLAVQLLVVVLGFAFVFSPEVLTNGFDLSPGQGWHDVLFALPLAMLAYTGLETVANLAEETREPGTTLPRSLFSSIGLVVIMTVLIAVVGVCAFPADDGTTELADQWLQAPIVGIVTAFEGHVSAGVVDMLRVLVGLSGAVVLFAAATTAITGCTRLTRSMAEHGMLPREFGRLERRSLVSRESLIAIGVLAVRGRHRHGHARRRRRGLPREHVLVRRPVRFHGRAARGDPAATARARPRTAVPGPARGADPRRPRSGARSDRGAALLRRLGAGADHASRRALRGADLAARRARCLRGRAAQARGGCVRRHRSRRAAAAGNVVPQDPRADEAR